MSEELEKKDVQSLAETPVNTEPVYGLEDANNEDLIVPRIKVINALSPERQDGIANEGDLVNSLTKKVLPKDSLFVPIKQFYTNIYWDPDRSAEQRIICRSTDGHIGNCADGSVSCALCKKNKFDNTKVGKDAQPLCTAYMNFLGFIVGDPMPVILSFAKTNYAEGRKLMSIAKSLRCNIWNYSYILAGKQQTKDKNRWYNIDLNLYDVTDAATRTLAFAMFKEYQNVTNISTDYEDTSSSESTGTDAQTASEIA